MRKIIFPIVLAISLLGGCSHGKVTSIGKDSRYDKLEVIIAEIKKEEEETKRKEIIKAQKLKEEEQERIIAERKAKEEAERKERERIAEKNRQAQLAAAQQKQTKSNDLNGDGFIDQYEWSKMSSGEQKQWTKDLTECVDSGKDDCERE
ncbi:MULTISPECIES: hypothetical protein [unclassified Bacillus (in: firmicutes)]|uniref:hypothetical protein n=1 Tax=unclassified Bacillus (in: firmicutes) TaxID=185979 RepID=UPI001BEC6F9A|nr:MULTISPECIES: hypothetical protein [unclassified Bacillus (in: firmicutes)]MBT2615142.1 hypothetical protein [Bacillus sp. ISL-78]MBT2628245.1 hypothetical protein [Bacillus sp. ISL-101]